MALDPDGDVVGVLDMPVRKTGSGNMVDPRRLLSSVEFVYETYGFGMVCIEVVWSRPRQMGQFRFGVGFGMALMAAEMLCVEGEEVRMVMSNQWKGWMGIEGFGKEGGRELALARTGREDLFGKAKYDGRGDAWCLAEWLRRARLKGAKHG